MKAVWNRLGLPGVFVVCGLLVALLTRVTLLMLAANELDGGMDEWARIFAIGFFYDVAVAIYWLAPLLFFRALLPKKVLDSKVWHWVALLFFFAGVFLLQFVAVSEWFFWDEFKARFNFISVDYLIYRREVTDNIFESYPVYPIFAVIGVISLIITLWVSNKIKSCAAPAWPSRFAWFASAVIASVGVFTIVNSTSRDSFSNPYARELASDGPYQFFSAYRNNELDFNTFYKTIDDVVASEALKHQMMMKADGLYRIDHDVAARGEEYQLNVVLVVIESLSAKYVGFHGNTEGLTPYMDALAKESLVFDNFYATGTRTVRGLEAVSLSIPPTPGQSIVRRPDNAGLFSIGTPFLDRGYDTTFFYGGYGYFDNMNAFFSGIGFNILDRTDIPDDKVTFSNAWGVADEDIYAQVIERADQDWDSGKSFFSLVMTTSNHRPYTYPEGRIDIPSGDGRRGAVKYTDWAIGDFIERVKHKPWFDSTIFVFVADHCAGVAGKTALPVKNYHIPLLMYSPSHLAPRHEVGLAGQLDLAPTLMSLLNFNYHSWFFGRDVLSDTRRDAIAFISNYQDVGVLEPDILTVLRPQQKVVQFGDPMKEQVELLTIKDQEEVVEAIAFYQGASQIWQQRLSRMMPADLQASASQQEYVRQ